MPEQKSWVEPLTEFLEEALGNEGYNSTVKHPGDTASFPFVRNLGGHYYGNAGYLPADLIGGGWLIIVIPDVTMDDALRSELFALDKGD